MDEYVVLATPDRCTWLMCLAEHESSHKGDAPLERIAVIEAESWDEAKVQYEKVMEDERAKVCL